MIDVRCHYYPERFTELITRLSGRNQPRFPYPTADAEDQIAARLKLMDQAGVQLQVLCPSSSYPYFPNESDAVEAARLCSDSFAELVSRYPDRFAAYVSLPLPHIEASLRELERCLDQKRMLGATMSLSVLDRSTAEVEFEPIYAELNRRGALLPPRLHRPACPIHQRLQTRHRRGRVDRRQRHGLAPHRPLHSLPLPKREVRDSPPGADSFPRSCSGSITSCLRNTRICPRSPARPRVACTTTRSATARRRRSIARGKRSVRTTWSPAATTHS
jgi:hypothetical protein